MGADYISGEDLAKVYAKLENEDDLILTEILKKLEQNPEILKESVQMMLGEEPFKNYAKNLFGKKFSNVVGFTVDNDMFIDAMVCIMPSIPEDVCSEYLDQAILYKRENTEKYYKEGFGKEFKGNISNG